MEITINSNHCTRCIRCVSVCPASIFSSALERSSTPQIQHQSSCIGCGHCIDACRDGAIYHELFPTSTRHTIDYTQYPTPKQMLTILQSRRSNRAFTKKQVPISQLEDIARAAHLAPTASNIQGVNLTILTKAEDLKTVIDFTMMHFTKLHRRLTNPIVRTLLRPFMSELYNRYVPAFERLIESYEAGGDPILRGATSLLLIHTPKGSRFGSEDSNLAYQNGSLMAESLGVSQIYTGYLLVAVKSRRGQLEKLLNIDGQLYAGMALGLPKFRYDYYVDRKEFKVEIR